MNKSVLGWLFAGSIGVAGVAALSIWFGAFNNLVGNEPHWRPAEVPVIEMMAPETDAFVQQHEVGADGIVDKTLIQFRNGDTGTKVYRDDGTLSEYTIEYLGGGTRLYSQYAPNGKQVIAGYELRDDRSMKWKATNTENLIEVTTYYYDGTNIFSVAHQKVNDQVVDVRYYREDHTQWAHHRYRESASVATLELHELYDQHGNPLYRLENQPAKTLVTYYRTDGTINLVQHWNAYSMGPMGGGGLGLQVVESYDSTGKSVTRRWQFSTTGGVLMSFIDYLGDGTQVHTEVRGYDKLGGIVRKVVHKAADGTVLHVNVPRSEMTVSASPELTAPRPMSAEPVREWSRLESLHAGDGT